MASQTPISLIYDGLDADEHAIDFYDVSRALIGFQPSLAITTHAIINGEVITQAPSLKNASILLIPPEQGSWKITALIATSIWTLGTAPKDTPFGNIIGSAYDYVISESLGFHVDYDSTLLKQYEEHQKSRGLKKIISQSRLDDVIDKCHNAVEDLHRPIIFSETAARAQIRSGFSSKSDPIGPEIDQLSYDYISYSEQLPDERSYIGRVSAYAKNTYKGRIYVPTEGVQWLSSYYLA